MSRKLDTAVLCLLLLHDISECALLAMGQIEQCSNDGLWLDCNQKLVVSLTLSNGSDGSDSAGSTQLTTVKDTDGAERTLSEPWSITLSKSDVYIQCPLQYLQAFHAQPTELVIEQTPNLFGFGGCVDDPNSNPTCGWARTAQGENIPDSQGFCCSCIAGGQETTRGLNGTCDSLGSDTETAHCLSFDNEGRWYSAYSMSNCETYFDIIIMIDFDNGADQQIIMLSPSNTAVVSDDGQFIVQYYSNQSSQISMHNHYFFTPSAPSGDNRVTNWMQNSMLVEKNAVSLDDSECDKIGVSYSAFRAQSNPCEKQQGECLNNQLEDYHQNGSHFAMDLVEDMNMLYNSESMYLSYVENSNRQSFVTLTISTDDVSFTTNRAEGHIEDCQINNFESYTSSQLNCTVQNDGSVDAVFRMVVWNCTNGISSIPDKESIVKANSVESFKFDVVSMNLTDSTHRCDVVLFDSLAIKIDIQQIEFESTKTMNYSQDSESMETTENIQNSESLETTNGNSKNDTMENEDATDSESNDGVEDTQNRELRDAQEDRATATQSSCESHCNSWIDIPCFVKRSCSAALGKAVGILCIFLLVLIVCLCTSPWWFKHAIRCWRALPPSSNRTAPKVAVAVSRNGSNALNEC